jgi:hypothetical protein
MKLLAKNRMDKCTEVSRADWVIAAIHLSLYIGALVTGAVLLIRMGWPLGLIAWVVIIAGGGMFLLITWHARNLAYRCRACHHESEISVLGDLISPNVTKGKYPKCPGCHRRVWTEALKKKR